MNDLELIKLCNDILAGNNSAPLFDYLGISIDRIKMQDQYKDKIYSWEDIEPEAEDYIREQILTYFMDDDLRVKLQKYILEHI